MSLRAEFTKDIVVGDGSWIDPRAYGSGQTDADLTAAASAAAGSKPIIVPPGTWTISNNLDLSAQIVRAQPGVIFSISAGVTLTLNDFDADRHEQCFSGDGSVSFSRYKEVYPEWWGIDGTADDVQIQAAGDALSDTYGGKIVLRDGKTYTLAAGLTWTDKNYFSIEGQATLDGSSLPASDDVMTIVGSDPGLSTTMTVAGSAKDTSLTVASSASFSVGDMIGIISTEDFDENDANYKKSELNFVEAIGGGTNITLLAGLKQDYSITGETVTIYRYDHIKRPIVKGVKMIGGGGGNDNDGLIVRYATDASIENVSVEACESTGIYFGYTDHGKIDHCRVSGSNDCVTPTGYSYSFGSLSQYCNLVNSYSEDHRHGFTTTSYHCVWHCRVSGNKFVDYLQTNMSGMLTHRNGVHLVITDNSIEGGYLGIGVICPWTVISNNNIKNVTYSGIYVTGGGTKGILVTGNRLICNKNSVLIGNPGSVSAEDQGGIVVGNVVINSDIDGTGLTSGINITAANVLVSGNFVRNGSPGITISGNDVHVIGNSIVDVSADADAYGIKASTTGTLTGVVIKNNKVWSEIASVMTNAVYVGTDVEDVEILDNYLIDYTLNSPISDNGTRTRFKNNKLKDGSRQIYRILGTTAAGCADGTTVGKAKTTNTAKFEINGRINSKAATDDLFDLTGVTTGAAEYKKVLLCLDISGNGSIVEGVAAATQLAARVPDWWDYDVVPVGVVEIPNSYSGGDLDAMTFYDFIGQVS